MPPNTVLEEVMERRVYILEGKLRALANIY